MAIASQTKFRAIEGVALWTKELTIIPRAPIAFKV